MFAPSKHPYLCYWLWWELFPKLTTPVCFCTLSRNPEGQVVLWPKCDYGDPWKLFVDVFAFLCPSYHSGIQHHRPGSDGTNAAQRVADTRIIGFQRRLCGVFFGTRSPGGPGEKYFRVKVVCSDQPRAPAATFFSLLGRLSRSKVRQLDQGIGCELSQAAYLMSSAPCPAHASRSSQRLSEKWPPLPP